MALRSLRFFSKMCNSNSFNLNIDSAGYKNTFFDLVVEKNRVRQGKNINFTRVVVTLALLGHQTSHSK